jgi:hypothetical protein
MKLKDLILAKKTIQSHTQDKMPSRLAYKMMKLLKASESEDAFYNEKMKQIVNEFALKNEDGTIRFTDDGGVLVKNDMLENFNAAITELEEMQVDIPEIKFTLSELESINFSISEMFTLDEFIEE